jgi:hypothetical protein
MPLVQFRIHPSVGIARMGDSETFYYLASEFPHFLQEEFANLRLKTKPRTHPFTFFGSNKDSARATGSFPFVIYDPTAANHGKFRDAAGKIFPQAARFRVFAYVYNSGEADLPDKVFEVTTAEANVVWQVNIANKKSGKNDPSNPSSPGHDTSKPHENQNNVPTLLDTSDPTLICERMRPQPTIQSGMRFPNLAYLFLERDDADPSKVTGRLHVIGNEGDTEGLDNDPGGSAHPDTLWSNNWYDSAGDGSIGAIITPHSGATALLAKAGISKIDDLKYLNHDVPTPVSGTTADITAAPAWVVVGCPDYSPDMSHFVTLWDVALSQAIYNVENKDVIKQPGKHKLVKCKSNTESLKKTDYLIHIHPQLCLFEDVRFVSGEAFGKGGTEDDNTAVYDRAHNLLPPGTPPPPATTDVEAVRGSRIEFGGVAIHARTPADKTALADPTKLKDPDPTKPINEWLKIALFRRLRKPPTLYRKARKFRTHLPGASGDTHLKGMFPRKLGRRMDYDKPEGLNSDKNKFHPFPSYAFYKGNLRVFRPILTDDGKLCGGEKSPPKWPTGVPFPPLRTTDDPKPTSTRPPVSNDEKISMLDDMFWPASFADMPLLRELAYTHLQYDNFLDWQGDPKNVRLAAIFTEIVSPSLRTSFNAAGDADSYFAALLAERPRFAPAMIDMAHLGSMLGGSFLPGIEVGREGAIATNWCLFHGGTSYFADVRFKPARSTGNHTIGTLTKDLAVPWSKDYASCDEQFWPTARMGRVTTDGTNRVDWIMSNGQLATFLHRPAATFTEGDYVKAYWKALGFVRRNSSDQFIEQEAPWRGP